MLVVADTTPLNYLLIIGECDLLPRLFERVVVPASVIGELLHFKAPPVVRAWAGKPPGWVEVAAPAAALPAAARLDAGEADAIALAVERKIPDILIDERRGMRVARAEGLVPLPTLLILERAAERKLIELPTAIARLRQTSIRIPDELVKAALARDQARRKSS